MCVMVTGGLKDQNDCRDCKDYRAVGAARCASLHAGRMVITPG
jgi:hypothetical protein